MTKKKPRKIRFVQCENCKSWKDEKITTKVGNEYFCPCKARKDT